jgi:flagellar biosynthesis protein FlhF
MKLKSFFADTIEEAIRLARRELGPDAMLVNSQRAGVEARHLGFYEVVVCGETPDAGSTATSSSLSPVGSLSPVASLQVDKLSQDLSELKQRMEKLALTLARSGRGAAGVAFDPELSRVFTRLTDAELDTELAYDVVGKLSSPISQTILRVELGKLVRVDAGLGFPGAPSRVVVLVGPPGAGKTSALVKLAVQYGLTANKTVQIFTTDTYRIAAAEELRSYAAILGIGCQVLETPAALAHAIDDVLRRDEVLRKDQVLQSGEGRLKDLILIDTPGLCRSEMAACEDLAKLLATRYADVDTHLVLPASMRAADLRRVAEQYAVFRPRKLLFTRMDETETFGPILSLSVRMAKPVSFFSRGQRIPEDLEPATADMLLDLVLGPPSAALKYEVVAA